MFSFTFLLGEDILNLTYSSIFSDGLGSIQPPARNQILWCFCGGREIWSPEDDVGSVTVRLPEVAVAIPPSNDVDLFAHCAGEGHPGE